MYYSAKCNKVAGVYWLNQPLENLSMRVKLKAKESILTLPKFENYEKNVSQEDFHVLEDNKIEEYVFKWQEKLFSQWEYHKYLDVYNCHSELEEKYHEMVKDLIYDKTKLFTYIDQDYYLPLPAINKKSSSSATFSNLSSCFSKLKLDEKIDGNISSSMGQLFKKEDHLNLDNEEWKSMHIVLDNSEYDEDSQILYKEEHILLSLYHNVTHNYLIVSPNINDIEYNSYYVEALKLEYGVEINFGGENSSELEEFLQHLLKKWKKKQRKLLSFARPPLGKKKYYVMFEIVSAVDFDMDNLYIEFNIKIPEDIQCSGDCHGRTHVSKTLNSEEKHEWIYGHCIDLELECATGIDPLPLKIYLEAISVDWWGRHRTEGYCYLPLSLDPGCHKNQLVCCRPEELDSVEANSRRFFVGGCHLIEDLDVLSSPQSHNTDFKYISTGTISVRWNTISQSQIPGSLPPASHPSSSSLLKGAEAVLRQYKKAKATLAAAAKDLPNTLDGSGDG